MWNKTVCSVTDAKREGRLFLQTPHADASLSSWQLPGRGRAQAGQTLFLSHWNIGCILVAELSALALGPQTWIQFLASSLGGSVTGHVLSEPVSTSVKWIIVRIKRGHGHGERASYHGQE